MPLPQICVYTLLVELYVSMASIHSPRTVLVPPGGSCPPPPPPLQVASRQGPSKLMSHSFQSLGVTTHMCGLIGMFRVVLLKPPPLAILSSSICALHYFPSSTRASSDCSLCTVPFVSDVSEVFSTPHSCMHQFSTIQLVQTVLVVPCNPEAPPPPHHFKRYSPIEVVNTAVNERFNLKYLINYNVIQFFKDY